VWTDDPYAQRGKVFPRHRVSGLASRMAEEIEADVGRIHVRVHMREVNRWRVTQGVFR
jgi:hypothetical protein